MILARLLVIFWGLTLSISPPVCSVTTAKLSTLQSVPTSVMTDTVTPFNFACQVKSLIRNSMNLLSQFGIKWSIIGFLSF